MDLARTFLAISPDEPLRERLAALGSQLRAHFPCQTVRWVPPANYHLTLVFLGRTVLAELPRIDDCVTRVATSLAPFRYRLASVRAFPSARSPRVIAALPAQTEGFLAWQQPLAAALAAAGFPIEQRTYRPHLTLGRWRGRSGCPQTEDFPLDLEADAGAIRLYESREGRYWPLFERPCSAEAIRA